ncbi:MAG: NAD+ synthase [Nitrososphaerota archaeon]|nr:NAD+ synthase [Nitrososphaerota archaeon]MDG7024369.1 NAD+ synthase [Nitrososphaerota archaeon]
MPRTPFRTDPARETTRILRFIRAVVKKAGADGVVVGLSGGVDSAAVGALCVRALGKEKVTAVLMPSKFTAQADIEDAEVLAYTWGARVKKIEISPLADSLTSAFDFEPGKVPGANVQARIRMVILYYLSNSAGLLVAGTGDKSEIALGFYTKFGDGGADFLPIAHLYKTQVRALGRHLGLPEKVVTKPASPGLWPGHTAAEELPADYDALDPLLYYLFEKRLAPRKAASRAGVGVSVARKVAEMHRKTEHKRSVPPSLA